MTCCVSICLCVVVQAYVSVITSLIDVMSAGVTIKMGDLVSTDVNADVTVTAVVDMNICMDGNVSNDLIADVTLSAR